MDSSLSEREGLPLLEWGDFQVVEADKGFPIVESKVIVSWSGKRVLVFKPVDQIAIHPPGDRFAVRPLDLKRIRSIRDNGFLSLRDRILAERHFKAIWAMLIDAREHVECVLPTAEDDKVARGVRVRSGCCSAVAVAPNFSFKVTFWRSAHRLELDTRVCWNRALQPRGLVVHILGTELAVAYAPARTYRAPIGPKLCALKRVREGPGERRAG